MMKDIERRLTPYQWVMAILAIISIFLIILDFAAVINIDEPTSKWFWINSAIVVYFAIDIFVAYMQQKTRNYISKLTFMTC